MPDNDHESLVAKIRNSKAYRLEGHKFIITELISKLMEAEGLTRSEVASKLNKSKPYITQMLNGRTNFTIETLDGIAEALNSCLNVNNLFIKKCDVSDVGVHVAFTSASFPTHPHHSIEVSTVDMNTYCNERFMGRRVQTDDIKKDAA
jgi:antitoxin component HigA of HigAB toxin-antitoxin module